MESQGVPAARTAADYKSEVRPVWCPGCGHYTVLTAVLKALADQALAPENVALVSGIGCSSRIPAYTRLYGFHGVHGRALPAATGIKLARPELDVLVVGGDGDGFSIGGNHFLHACRRNLDLAYVVMDNQVYGMTKGQASPTTAEDWDGSELTPEGPGMTPVEPLRIALAAGANFVARCLSRDVAHTAATIVEAMRHPGFSFVQVLSPCVTYHPEHQKAWRDLSTERRFEATSDAAAASAQLAADEGFTFGVLYRGTRAAYDAPRSLAGSPAELESGFALRTAAASSGPKHVA